MTAEEKKLVKKQIAKEIEKANDGLLTMIRSEIRKATGNRWGYFKCESCGASRDPFYRDRGNQQIPFCGSTCGRPMTFKDLP